MSLHWQATLNIEFAGVWHVDYQNSDHQISSEPTMCAVVNVNRRMGAYLTENNIRMGPQQTRRNNRDYVPYAVKSFGSGAAQLKDPWNERSQGRSNSPMPAPPVQSRWTNKATVLLGVELPITLRNLARPDNNGNFLFYPGAYELTRSTLVDF
ncbi:hypothetical protein DEU56DRAFT_761281 [Suillus clintonianus]|uniref:uncharacterized protein n=1 Tax=Suillus clintonianus TaxID=1904413 RepID=UPI001B870F6B|nr:uncharacterized protein DEU56DRAFT_761281 [Suillus clintonianus]KAG2118317.1 hypothetical protein DEU56DRAFT_761281 [Suillus clintonianus]